MLILFDLDDTLISGYMNTPTRDYTIWEVLPGRRERLADLIEQGHMIGIVTNQAGVAWGFVTQDAVIEKLCQVAERLGMTGVTVHDGVTRQIVGWGALQVWVCFADARVRGAGAIGAERRKPSGAMIREAMRQYRQAAQDGGTLYVGDRPEDEAAAADAGVTFVWAHVFFGEETCS